MTNVNEKLLNEIKEQNQQILLLLQLLVASNEEIKMNYGKIQDMYNEYRYPPVYHPDFGKETRSYKKFYEDRIKCMYENDTIPMDIIKKLLNTKQK